MLVVIRVVVNDTSTCDGRRSRGSVTCSWSTRRSSGRCLPWTWTRYSPSSRQTRGMRSLSSRYSTTTSDKTVSGLIRDCLKGGGWGVRDCLKGRECGVRDSKRRWVDFLETVLKGVSGVLETVQKEVGGLLGDCPKGGGWYCWRLS